MSNKIWLQVMARHSHVRHQFILALDFLMSKLETCLSITRLSLLHSMAGYERITIVHIPPCINHGRPLVVYATKMHFRDSQTEAHD